MEDQSSYYTKCVFIDCENIALINPAFGGLCFIFNPTFLSVECLEE